MVIFTGVHTVAQAPVDVVILTPGNNSIDNFKGRSWGELPFAVALLRKHAAPQTLGRIIVAVNGELPASQIDGVEYIADADFVQAPHYPTNNGFTIMWHTGHLARKLKLTDPFIRFDDDTFVTAPIDLRKFADAKVHYIEPWKSHGYGPDNGKGRSTDVYIGAMESSNNALRELFGSRFKPSAQVAHLPRVERLSTLEYMWANLPGLQESFTNERSVYNFEFNYVYLHVESLIMPGVRISPTPLAYYHFIELNRPEAHQKKLFSTVLDNPRKFVTVNDNIGAISRAEHRLYMALFNEFMKELVNKQTSTVKPKMVEQTPCTVPYFELRCPKNRPSSRTLAGCLKCISLLGKCPSHQMGSGQVRKYCALRRTP